MSLGQYGLQLLIPKNSQLVVHADPVGARNDATPLPKSTNGLFSMPPPTAIAQLPLELKGLKSN
jgi:hypothetical protein